MSFLKAANVSMLAASPIPVAAQAQIEQQLEQMRQSCRRTEQTSLASCNQSAAGSNSRYSRYSEPSNQNTGKPTLTGKPATGGNTPSSQQQCIARVKQSTASCLDRVESLKKEIQNRR